MTTERETVDRARQNDSTAWIEYALEQIAAGDLAGAISAFRTALQTDPDNLEAHHGLVRALCDADQPDGAVAVALALTVLTPGDPLAHTSLSIALQQAGQIPQAEAAAGRARILEWKQQLSADADQEAHAGIP